MTGAGPIRGLPRRWPAEAAGKRIVFLSNAPRAGLVVDALLTGMGLDRALWDGIMTSGELAWRDLKRPRPGRFRGSAARLHIGPERDLSVVEDGRGLVAEPGEADFVLNTGPEPDRGNADSRALSRRAGGLRGAPAADGLRQSRTAT